MTLLTGIKYTLDLQKREKTKGSITKSDYKVLKIEGDEQICSRLREIGLRSGLTVGYLGRAPFNGPIFIQFKNSFWALRQNEAECVHIHNPSETMASSLTEGAGR